MPLYCPEKIAARLMGVSPKKLQKDRQHGQGVPAQKFGRSVRYRIADILKYIEKKGKNHERKSNR